MRADTFGISVSSAWRGGFDAIRMRASGQDDGGAHSRKNKYLGPTSGPPKPGFRCLRARCQRRVTAGRSPTVTPACLSWSWAIEARHMTMADRDQGVQCQQLLHFAELPACVAGEHLAQKGEHPLLALARPSPRPGAR